MVRGGFAGAGIPVGGVSEIPFLAVQVGVDPGSGSPGDFLAKVVGGVPLPGLGEPEGAGGRGGEKPLLLGGPRP